VDEHQRGSLADTPVGDLEPVRPEDLHASQRTGRFS
jgi:hypothetical protein